MRATPRAAQAATLMALVLLMAIGCAARPVPTAPPPAATERDRWIQDLRHALAAIEAVHPEFDHKSDRSQFESEIATADEPILGRRDAFFSLLRLVALVGDAHTRVADLEEIADLRLPINLEWWSDGLWIASVHAGAEDLFGLRVVAIEGRPVAEVVESLRVLVPHDNDLVLRAGAARLMSLPRALAETGVIPEASGAQFDLEAPDGSRRTAWVASIRSSEAGTPMFLAPVGWEAPMWRRSPYEAWRWWELDAGRILYLAYNRCVGHADRPFAELAGELLSRIDAGGVERVVVDLRMNAGGNTEAIEPLTRGLERRGIRGDRVVVVIGTGTFSSAMLNAVSMERRLDAVLVGEPTSQKPDSFGELRTVSLPNTGWRIEVSTKRFTVFGGDRASLEPRITIANRFSDLLAGRDPVLEWVMGQ